MPHLEQHYGGTYIVHGRAHGTHGTLVQTDWDFPSTADGFGWSLTRVQAVGRSGAVRILARRSPTGCQHHGTDGTVDCPECGVTASQFIDAARDYLDQIAR